MARAKNEKYGVADDIIFSNGTQEEEKKQDNTAEKKGYNLKSLENLHPRESGTAQPKAYMQLNIYECEDYIYRMSKVQKKTMSGYVLDLIKKDMEQNKQAYEGLKLIKELDKPKRKAKNTKKTEK